jgi:Helix-turn-helix domain
MRGFAGACRFVFNRALAFQKELFELSGAHADPLPSGFLQVGEDVKGPHIPDATP